MLDLTLQTLKKMSNVKAQNSNQFQIPKFSQEDFGIESLVIDLTFGFWHDRFIKIYQR